MQIKAALDIVLDESGDRKMSIDMQYWELYFFRFVSASKLVYFSDLLGFK